MIESLAKYGFITEEPATSTSSQTSYKTKKTKEQVQATIDLPDYYKLLGVERDATDADLHAAYRRLAQQYHPDVNKSVDAEAQFIEIKRAYEILRDPSLRKSYDRQSKAA